MLQVCVEKCPDKEYVFLENVADQDKSNLICKDNVNTAKKVTSFSISVSVSL